MRIKSCFCHERILLVLNNDLRIGDFKGSEKKYELRGSLYLKEDSLEILGTYMTIIACLFILESTNAPNSNYSLLAFEDYFSEEVARSFERQAFDLTNVYRPDT